MDEIAYLDDQWDAWDKLDEECNKRRADVQRLIDAVRTTRRIPKRDIERVLPRVRRLLGEIRAAEFRPIDREELASRANMQLAVLTFLRNRSHTEIEPSSTKIRDLMDSTQAPAQFADRLARYASQTMLVILSKPAGNAYWQLMRGLANGVKEDRKTSSDQRLREIQDVVNFLAPAWLLYDDRKHIPSNGKWAWRTTKVHGIYNGGLPGLGKKA